MTNYYRSQSRIGHYGSVTAPLPLLGTKLQGRDLSRFCFEQNSDPTSSIQHRLEALFSLSKDDLVKKFNSQEDSFDRSDEIKAWLDHHELFRKSWVDARIGSELRRNRESQFHDIAVSEVFRAIAANDGKSISEVAPSTGFADLINANWDSTSLKASAVRSFVRALIHWYGVRDSDQLGAALSYQHNCSTTEFLTIASEGDGTRKEDDAQRIRQFEVRLPNTWLLGRTTGDYFVIVRSSIQFAAYRNAINAWRELPESADDVAREKAASDLERTMIAYLDFVIDKLAPGYFTDEAAVWTGGLVFLRNSATERVAIIISTIFSKFFSARKHGPEVPQSIKEQTRVLATHVLEKPTTTRAAAWAKSQIDGKLSSKYTVSVRTDRPIALDRK